MPKFSLCCCGGVSTACHRDNSFTSTTYENGETGGNRLQFDSNASDVKDPIHLPGEVIKPLEKARARYATDWKSLNMDVT